MPDHQQCNNKPQPASAQRHQVRGPVALQAIRTRPLASGTDMGMLIEHEAVKQVEYIARYDRTESHEPPVLAEAVDAECLCDNRREDAEEKTVAETGQAGDGPQVVWVLDAEGADLRYAEDEARQDQTPNAGGFDHFDKEV